MINSDRPRTFSWWFTRGWASVITIPIFLFLAYGTVKVFLSGVIQTYAYFRVLMAVGGSWGLVVFLLVLPWCLIFPGALWFISITEIPRVITTQAKSKKHALGYFVAGCIILLGSASGLQWLHGELIAWVADRDPNAAYKAGVTGNIPPSFEKR